MKLRNIIILVSISLVYACVFAECFSSNHVKSKHLKKHPVGKLKKLPMVIKRTFKNWKTKNDCIERIMRSTAAKVKLSTPDWFRFTSRMPPITTPLLESQILLEFHKVEKMSQVKNYNYSIDIQPIDSKSEPEHIKINQFVGEGNIAEFFFNITSIHYKLMTSNKKYMRLRYRFFVTQGNTTQIKTTMPFRYVRMKPYLITVEENKNCSGDILTRDAEKLQEHSGKQAPLRNTKKLLDPANNKSHYTCRLPDTYAHFSNSHWSSFAITPFNVKFQDINTCSLPFVTNTTKHDLPQTANSNTRCKTSVCCASITTEQAALLLPNLQNMFIIRAENLIGIDNECQ